mmetsp:Transcript_103692/g.278618  ORF Transcript_103692/g.278618 Transcript_103692/m.278618 type:complete len:346 (+) Transcript_103692:402-1439(+)
MEASSRHSRITFSPGRSPCDSPPATTWSSMPGYVCFVLARRATQRQGGSSASAAAPALCTRPLTWHPKPRTPKSGPLARSTTRRTGASKEALTGHPSFRQPSNMGTRPLPRISFSTAATASDLASAELPTPGAISTDRSVTLKTSGKRSNSAAAFGSTNPTSSPSMSNGRPLRAASAASLQSSTRRSSPRTNGEGAKATLGQGEADDTVDASDLAESRRDRPEDAAEVPSLDNQQHAPAAAEAAATDSATSARDRQASGAAGAAARLFGGVCAAASQMAGRGCGATDVAADDPVEVMEKFRTRSSRGAAEEMQRLLKHTRRWMKLIPQRVIDRIRGEILAESDPS